MHGFTLIELVVVIVIVGIIAAIAVPRFISMGTDARVAAVKAGAGAVTSAASLAYMKCILTAGCAVDGSLIGAQIAGPSGVQGIMYFGYPTGTSRLPYWFGIKDWVQMDGFDVNEVSFTTTDFALTGAPDPTNCKVTYLESFGSGPVVTATVSGC